MSNFNNIKVFNKAPNYNDEVVSKARLRFKGPAKKRRDFISNFNRLMYSTRLWLIMMKWFQNLRSRPKTRREFFRKRSIHVSMWAFLRNSQRRIWVLDEVLKPLLVVFIDLVLSFWAYQLINLVLNLSAFFTIKPLVPVEFRLPFGDHQAFTRPVDPF